MNARRSISMVLVWLCATAGGLLLCSAPALAQREHAFSKSFGSEGSGDGQLMRPGALAVSEVGPMAGDVYVIDRGNSRVEIFSATGAYVGQFNGSEAPTGGFSWPQRPRPEGGIAIDNSTNPLDPSAGDVYVVDTGHHLIDKFKPSGVYIGQITGTPTGGSFAHVNGVAVDSNGALWVQASNTGEEASKTGVKEFNDELSNEFLSETSMLFKVTTSETGALGLVGFAIDSEGNFYFGHSVGSEYQEETEPVKFISKFDSAGTLLEEEVGGEELARGVAVDRSSNDVYVDNETAISAFSSAGALLERFGSGQMHASAGIAVNAVTGTIYASDAIDQAVEVFTAFTVPDVSTSQDSVANFGETSVTVSGTVDPDGLPVTSCVFEYGTSASYGQEAPCSSNPGSGEDPVSVSANLSGLEPLTHYHFRLRASNANGFNQSQDREFLTPVPVLLGDEAVSDVASDSAQFSADVNPGGADTRFRFEYGTSTSYGESVPVPEGDLGAGTGMEPVSVRPEDLQPETTYHVRIVATNVLGAVYGPDQTFTTQSGGGAFGLPDGRLWELVSPPNKYGAGIEPLPFEGLGEGVVEAAEDGSGITYLANGPVVASAAGNPSPYWSTQVLSRRRTGGWSSQDMVSPSSTLAKVTNSNTEFLFFSPDLSQVLVEPPGNTPLSPEATEKTVYTRNNDTENYLPLVTAANVPQSIQFGGKSQSEQVHGLMSTPDFSHILLESEVPLTSNAQRGSGSGSLYEWADGRLELVSELPNGTPSIHPTLGARSGLGLNDRHALSSNGARVFWTSLESANMGPLYMRETEAHRTVLVDAPAPGVAQPPASKARYEIASVTGSKVFFLDEEPLTSDSKLPPTDLNKSFGEPDLYVYDTEAQTLTDLTVNRSGNEPADVQDQVLGASEDGSVVYFVATGALANGAQPGEDNLYVVSEAGSTWSAPRFIAVLSPEDLPTWRGNGESGPAAKVSPNGRFLAFMSGRSLTGYENRDVVSGAQDEEVFLYDETDGQLKCVSCDPTGARPTGVFEANSKSLLSDRQGVWQGHWLAADIPAWNRVDSVANLVYQARYLTDEGRLFFNGFDSLVPWDTNGKADVYEYEPHGVGSCERSNGCVSLISSGTSSEESTLLDASGMGPGGGEAEDVFFLTTSRLTAQDYDTSFDVYDAHVCSRAVPCAPAPASPPECSSGDACKAAPSPQPAIFGAPASATFSGAGNLSSVPPAASSKSAKKKAVKHRKRKRSRKHKTKRSEARRRLSGKTSDVSKGRGR